MNRLAVYEFYSLMAFKGDLISFPSLIHFVVVLSNTVKYLLTIASQYSGLSSITLALRPNFSLAMMVVPEPPKASIIICPGRDEFSIPSINKSTGFIVGCNVLLVGLLKLSIVDGTSNILFISSTNSSFFSLSNSIVFNSFTVGIFLFSVK